MSSHHQFIETLARDAFACEQSSAPVKRLPTLHIADTLRAIAASGMTIVKSTLIKQYKETSQ